jgi:TonB family protein
MKPNKILSNLLAILLLGTFSISTFAQVESDNYQEIEKKMDRIENLYAEIYEILEEYPESNYTYVREDGKVSEVKVDGIPNERDKKKLELYLIDMEDLKSGISNLTNRVGIYYVTETEPKPEMGYTDFYSELHSNLSYPSEAEDNGVEGTVFVKFIVDPEGNVENVFAVEDIETSFDWVINDLKKEAKMAVKATSGKWEPAKIGGVPVSQWVMIPVQFKLESPYTRGFL